VSLGVIFLGTPEPARTSLQAILRAGHDVLAVVCQPDRPAGRGRKLKPPPVKSECQDRSLDVLQPESITDPQFAARLKALQPDVLVTVAYGQILPQAILDVPGLMPINLHFSLLPALRGAAPVNWAIINGLEETGVSVIQMVRALDAGPILKQKATAIKPLETAGQLAARLSAMGADLLVQTLAGLEAGTIEPRAQDESRASLAPVLKPADGHLDLSQPARRVQARGRGVTPWPGASVAFGDQRLKLFGLAFDESPAQDRPGQIVDLGPLGFKIACGQGHLFAAQVQHPGKRPVEAAAAARGAGPRVGDRLGHGPAESR